MIEALMVFAGVILMLSIAFMIVCLGISEIDSGVLDKLLKKEKDE